jgi:capsular polysaccharide biosynthesis protein
MDVRAWLTFLRDWIVLLAVGAVLAGGAAYVISSMLPRVYESEARLLVGQSLSAPNPDYTQLLASQVIAQTYAEVATARPTLERVIDDLGLDMSPEELAAAVNVRAPANSTLLVIGAQSSDAEEAAAIANTLAQTLVAGVEDSPIEPPSAADLTRLDEEIVSISNEIETLLAQNQLSEVERAQVSQLQDEREALRAERADLASQLTSSANHLTIIEPAIGQGDPISPRPLLNAGIGAFIGFVVMVLAAYAYETSERGAAARGESGAPSAAGMVRRPR